MKRLREYNVHTNHAVIEYKSETLAIDTSLLGVFEHALDSLYQFIGEMDTMWDDLGKEVFAFETCLIVVVIG